MRSRYSDPTYALLTNIDQPVLVCREDGHILWINRYFYRLSGNKDITGQNTSLFFAPPGLPCSAMGSISPKAFPHSWANGASMCGDTG